MGDTNKSRTSHEQYLELQQLLKNLGITTKYSKLSEADEQKADELFPD